MTMSQIAHSSVFITPRLATLAFDCPRDLSSLIITAFSLLSPVSSLFLSYFFILQWISNYVRIVSGRLSEIFRPANNGTLAISRAKNKRESTFLRSFKTAFDHNRHRSPPILSACRMSLPPSRLSYSRVCYVYK